MENRCVWWDAVAGEAERYELQPWMATEKFRLLCANYARCGAGADPGPVRTWTNRLYVIPCPDVKNWYGQPLPEGKLGMFYEFDLESIHELMPLLTEKIQTAVCIGMDPAAFLKAARDAGVPGIDRAVYAGEALEFDTVWDRKDLIGMLTE